jgi:hypothetical protein
MKSLVRPTDSVLEAKKVSQIKTKLQQRLYLFIFASKQFLFCNPRLAMT